MSAYPSSPGISTSLTSTFGGRLSTTLKGCPHRFNGCHRGTGEFEDHGENLPAIGIVIGEQDANAVKPWRRCCWRRRFPNPPPVKHIRFLRHEKRHPDREDCSTARARTVSLNSPAMPFDKRLATASPRPIPPCRRVVPVSA
jgi:hypothetical protein